ncbi:hypothetical protein LPB140_02640 [Sphingorhabdus lutea]|uniref:DUF5076 domain-containing protein n=1 Tax=Sphingorhabdus lutea TaxID=1913578 RepID=A0A1L3JA09_9SPHN|nr:DUF5076 domain-containing protein [Sphingorhabdus lutea]APG61903.1 hypothetical protein LPB140_02640 [Sphingorhabdus lutea]
MSNKPIPIDLVPHADIIQDSKEFLRMWVKNDGASICFINPIPIGPNPSAFGTMMVDAIRHAAKTYVRATGISQEEALNHIWQAMDKERGNEKDHAILYRMQDE